MNRDDLLMFLIAIALGCLAGVGIWLIVDATLTGKITRWPI
jgi:hypothetical protein